MKLLVICQDYPTIENRYAMQFVHSRNIIYKQKGIDVTVLNFRADKDYVYNGIRVVTEKSIIPAIKNMKYDIVISHAPNIKNHIRFLKKYDTYFDFILTVFHGHEALKISKYYPKPYNFRDKKHFKRLMFNIYDYFKLKILKKVILNYLDENKIHMIFVSEWMRESFIKSTEFEEKVALGNSTIIHNNSNEVFLNQLYEYNHYQKLADFITIRPFDDSKYAIDIVVKFAEANPNYDFHIYGRGEYFERNVKPQNVKIFDYFLEHKTIPNILNKYKCALMPTRLDAQGVMMCEFATYGIPLITSDLPICKEMLGDFANVYYISNNTTSEYYNFDINNINSAFNKNDKFGIEKTVLKEINLVKDVLKKKGLS